MTTRTRLMIASMTVALASLTPAQHTQNVTSGLTGAGVPLAIHGYDLVTYFAEGLPTLGSAKHTAKHGGAAYRFRSADNQKAFEANPGKYLPQYGGFCAFGITVGKKFDGDPRVFKIINEKLYFNLNPKIKAMWLKDIPGNIAKANGKWVPLSHQPAYMKPAKDAQNMSSSLTGASVPLAIHGYDPVGYFTDGLAMLGSAEHTATHKGVAYRFVSAAHQATFTNIPTAYLPQFGGYCAFGVTVAKKFDGDPRLFAIVEGKLYFNLNPDIQALWSKDKPTNIQKAEAQWPKIEAKKASTL